MTICSVFFACLSSDPRVFELSSNFGYYAGAFCTSISLMLLYINWHRHSFAWFPLYACLMLVHPMWTLAANTSDCGYSRRFFSVAISCVFVAILSCQLVRPKLRVTQFFVYLTVATWILYCISFAFLYPQLFPVHSFSFLLDFPGATAVQTFEASSSRLGFVALVMTAICFVMHFSNRARRKGVSLEVRKEGE